MRPLPKEPVYLRGRAIGAARPAICIPLVAMDREDALEEAKNIASLSPDVVEARADFWSESSSVDTACALLSDVRQILGDIPLLLTCRKKEEGGYRHIDQEEKISLYERAIASGAADAVDMELSCGQEVIGRVKEAARPRGAALVVSFHDFNATPRKREIVEVLGREFEAGADIAKVAVMINSHEEALELLASTLEARRRYTKPVVAVAMGEMGAFLRLLGCFFGSDLTFASSGRASAPGQPPFEAIKCYMDMLFGFVA